jgi:hypothetical protein
MIYPNAPELPGRRRGELRQNIKEDKPGSIFAYTPNPIKRKMGLH